MTDADRAEIRKTAAEALNRWQETRAVVCEHSQIIDYGDAAETVLAAVLSVRDAELDRLSQENTHLDLARIELEKWVTQETLRAERAEAKVARLRDGIVPLAARLVRMPIDDEATEDAVRDVARSLGALVWPRRPAPWEAAAPGQPPAEKEEDPSPGTIVQRTMPPYCCDLHNMHCEPPGDLCCGECAEARHPEHPPAIRCVLEIAHERMASGTIHLPEG